MPDKCFRSIKAFSDYLFCWKCMKICGWPARDDAKTLSANFFSTMGTNKSREETFRFKKFSVRNSVSAMKVGTDGVLLGAWANGSGMRNALDVGTGSGLIALMLAQRYSRLSVTAIELDPIAADEARVNVYASPWSQQISVINVDFKSYTPDVQYDLIVCNPPFFKNALVSADSRRTIARHTTTLDYRLLIDRSVSMLSPEGKLAMILPAEFENDVCFLASLAKLSLCRLVRVFTKPSAPPRRILVEFIKGYAPNCLPQALVINSPEYKSLTHEFYL